MASLLSNEGAQLRSKFDKFCEELYELVDRRECDIEFDHGKIMAESDSEMMEVSYAESASKAFWKPYVRDAKLDEASVFSSGYTGCLSKSAGPRGEDGWV